MNIVVKWDKMGPEFSYNIWYATKITGPWTRYNDIRLTDDIVDAIRNVGTLESYGPASEYNEYTLTGLNQEKNYSIKITCHDRYSAWWYNYNGPGKIDGGLFDPTSRPDVAAGSQQGFQVEVMRNLFLIFVTGMDSESTAILNAFDAKTEAHTQREIWPTVDLSLMM